MSAPRRQQSEESDRRVTGGVRVAVQHRLRFFREGLLRLLHASVDTEVVGGAVTGTDLVDLCHRTAPQVAVVEVDGDARTVLRSCATLSGRLPDLRFVGVHGGDADVGAVRAAGFRTLVPRADGFDGVLRALRTSLHEAPPSIAGVERNEQVRKDLTAREVDVLNLLGAGHTSQEISERLAISRKTVENHKQRIFTKLDVQNQAHAVAVAVRHGFITPDGIIELGTGA